MILPRPRSGPNSVSWLERSLMRSLNRRRIPTRTIAHAFGRDKMTVARHCRGLNRRERRTDETTRLLAKLRRDELRAAGLCLNGARHGPARHGRLCATCRDTHRRSA